MKCMGVSSDAVGKHVSQVVSPRNAIALGAAFERTLEGGCVQQRIVRDGRSLDAQTIPLHNKSGQVFAGIALVNDVTERVEAERRLMEQARELEALSLTDELTGLNNRRGFVTLAAQQLKVATRNLRHAAVIYLDVNDLKPVNDKLGHEEGDRLLRDVAAVLRQCFRDSDVMARLGGDEFAVLTVDIGPQNATMLEERVARAERTFNQDGDRPFHLSLSIGTELFDPKAPVALDELLARADERMYARKMERKRERASSE
jgi:diguanylate cyclase (GGDEF)-like protein